MTKDRGLGKQEMSCSSWRCTYNCIAHFSFSSDDFLIELLSIPVHAISL